MEKKKILVHFYIDCINNLDRYLNALKQLSDLADFDYQISISNKLNDISSIKNKIETILNNSNIQIVKEFGLDVYPFLTTIKNKNLNDYDYVLKLNTNSLDLNTLLGSLDNFRNLLSLLENKKTSLLCIKPLLIRNGEYDYYHFRINDELSKTNLKELDEQLYSIDNSYLIKAELLKPLLIYTEKDFNENIDGVNDYTFNHIFQKLIPNVILAQDYNIETIDYHLTDSIPQVDHKHKSDSLKKYLDKISGKIRFKYYPEETIAESEYFDEEWYTINNPEVKEYGNAARHYLLKGYKVGSNPSLKFDGNLYLNNNPEIQQNDINPLLHYECYGKYEGRKGFERETLPDYGKEIIRNSELFNEKWFINNDIYFKNNDIDLADHYYRHGTNNSLINPSPLFYGGEYYELNKDAKKLGINPLYHFETIGHLENRNIYCTDEIEKEKETKGTVKCQKIYSSQYDGNVAIVAIHPIDGSIPDSLIYLLEGLKEVSDNILLIGDNKIFRKELKKIEQLVSYVSFERHNQDYFGSYARGIRYLKDNDILYAINELIFINDSFYGPLFSFKESFEQMKKEKYDFWSYVHYLADNESIHSHFYSFNNKVIRSGLLEEFTNRIKGNIDYNITMGYLETLLPEILINQGMIYKTYIPFDNHNILNHSDTLKLINDYHIPLIKKYVLEGRSKENSFAVLRNIKNINPDLYSSLNITPTKQKEYIFKDAKDENIKFTIKKIKKKIKNKEKIIAYFLVANSAMFGAKPLKKLMEKDNQFETKLVVIPDMRFSDTPLDKMRETERQLEKEKEKIIKIRPDRFGDWPDILDDADLVFYSFPFNASIYKYDASYVSRKPFLPILIYYGISNSIYDRHIFETNNLTYYWKYFIENDYNLKEYQEHAINSDNAISLGYTKMDDLAKYKDVINKRKRIFVALHHSVDGGYNDSLALANFIRYFDYFKTLPDKYPDIDFVYRPHPFLFTTMENIKGWSKEDVDNYLNEMKNKPNVIWSEGGDYFEEFARCDGSIQDCASFVVEYIYTKKPCCYMLKDPSDIENKFAPLGKKCLEQYYISYNTDDIDNFINDVIINNHDNKKQSREDFAKEIMLNYPDASKRILDYIKKQFR